MRTVLCFTYSLCANLPFSLKKHMWSLIFVVLVVIGVTLVWAAGSIERVWHDASAPLNFLIYQPPHKSYSDEIVNLWVKKSWNSSGERIPAHVAKPSRDSGAYHILYVHGNAENLSGASNYAQFMADFIGVPVTTFDYSGYGLNKFDAWERSAEGVNRTTLEVFQEMCKTVSSERIVIYGFSLGTGPALKLAAWAHDSNVPIAGVISHAGYTSIIDLVREKTNSSVAEFFTERWNNRDTLSKLRCKVLIMHGKHDTVIPVSHAHELRRQNASACFSQLEKGHSNCDKEQVCREILRWLFAPHAPIPSEDVPLQAAEPDGPSDFPQKSDVDD